MQETEMIEKIFAWKIHCIPFTDGPISSMDIVVVARTRKEAELIVLADAHKFFDQDMQYTWNEQPELEGYREV